MKRISDFTVISDMDGTLLGHDGEIPQRNVEAIQRFTKKGGRFGIATGRSRGLMLERGRNLPINAPCVLYNGGALYDFETDTMLMERHLPETAKGYLEEIMDAMGDIGTMIISDDSYYQIKIERDFAHYFETRGKDHFHRSSVAEVTRPWYKILFLIEEQRIGAFRKLIREKTYPDVHFVGTHGTMIEMLPLGSTKASALEKAFEMELVRRESLVAIGDYYNDLEMIELAPMGVTLESSPEDIKAKASLVVGDCGNGAVADLIEHLEQLVGE